jgi:hypothetical protein
LLPCQIINPSVTISRIITENVQNLSTQLTQEIEESRLKSQDSSLKKTRNLMKTFEYLNETFSCIRNTESVQLAAMDQADHSNNAH